MHTLEDVKQELIDHLYSIDKSKMSTNDLKTYTEIVGLVNQIEKTNKPEPWTDLLKTMVCTGFSPAYKTVEMKEGEES